MIVRYSGPLGTSMGCRTHRVWPRIPGAMYLQLCTIICCTYCGAKGECRRVAAQYMHRHIFQSPSPLAGAPAPRFYCRTKGACPRAAVNALLILYRNNGAVFLVFERCIYISTWDICKRHTMYVHVQAFPPIPSLGQQPKPHGLVTRRYKLTAVLVDT